jgi:hypothetical protein
MTKKEHVCKKYGLIPQKILECDIISLGHVLCGTGGSIYNKDTSQNTLSAFTHNDRSRNTTLVALKLLKPKIRQQHSSWLERYPQPQCIVFDNGNMNEFKDKPDIQFKPTTCHNHQYISKCNH